MLERERFLNNLETFQRTAERMLGMNEDLKKLYEETLFLTSETDFLKEKLNRIAVELHLDPIPLESDTKKPAIWLVFSYRFLLLPL